jgi:hypothetical protein
MRKNANSTGEKSIGAFNEISVKSEANIEKE